MKLRDYFHFRGDLRPLRIRCCDAVRMRFSGPRLIM